MHPCVILLRVLQNGAVNVTTNMPFDPDNPPDKLKNLSEKKQRQWCNVFNSCWKEHEDDEVCHKMAWGVVNANAVANELVRVAKQLIAWGSKEPPATMFEKTFFDIREKAKAYKEEQSLKAGDWLKAQLIQDLKEKGFAVPSMDLSLGKYKGSRYISSAKLYVMANPVFVANDPRMSKLLLYLQTKYSPKYQLKDFQNGVAFFNVR